MVDRAKCMSSHDNLLTDTIHLRLCLRAKRIELTNIANLTSKSSSCFPET